MYFTNRSHFKINGKKLKYNQFINNNMLHLIENIFKNFKLSNLIAESFSQSPADDEEQSATMILAVFIMVIALRLLLVYALGSYLYNMTVAKSFGVKEITGTQAVALSVLLDVLM